MKLIILHNIVRVLFLFVLIISIASCSKKTGIPQNSTLIETTSVSSQDINALLEAKSVITINYAISNKAIKDTFQFIVDSVFKEEFIIDEYRVKSKLTRTAPMNVEMNNKDLLVELPISISISKVTLLGNVEAKGEVRMSFVSNIDIDSIWRLKTNTKLISHQWTKQPKLNVGGFNLPFESVSNIIINRAKNIIEEGIDQSIRESFNLRSMIMGVTQNYAKPYQIHNVYGGWFYMIPDSAYLSGIVNKQNTINGKISLITRTKVTSTKPDKAIFPKMPKVAWVPQIKDSSKISLLMDLSYSYLDSIANAEFKGQTFEESGKSITVQRIKVGPMGTKLQITANVSGSINGDIILTGALSYDKGTKIIKIIEPKMSMRTNNIFVSAATWLLKGKINKELNKMSEFAISDKIKMAQSQIDRLADEYYKPYNMQVTAIIDEPDIPLFQTRAENLTAAIQVKLYVHALFKDLSFFKE
jgi:hypothetical protein